MRPRSILLALAAAASLAACKKTGENEYQVKTPDVDVSNGNVTVSTDTHTVRTPDVEIGKRVDTVSAPVVRMQKDTVVVDKPVIVGREKKEVTSPTVEVKKP